MKYDVIIGLEIHAELKTKSKMFCTCKNDSQGAKPNQNTCPICLAHPGTLPYPNKQAIADTILAGLALHANIARESKFDRKHYFYPDLPKGYQISQYDLPLVANGYLTIDGERIEITRIHLEEDTGKSTHPKGKSHTLLDFNRAGTPLMELVTEPVIKDAEQAKKFCQLYQQTLRYLDISNADMEKGEMRCEANVSLQKKDKWEYKDGLILPLDDYKLNPKVELKNINSFKAMERAINFEIKRQTKAIDDNGKLIQETRGWDENNQKTVSQRIKESSADYRYFPEPDIPPLDISPEWIKKIRARLHEMPAEKIIRFQDQFGFNLATAQILVSNKKLANFTEQVVSELRAWIEANGDDWERQQKLLSKAVSNWLTGELMKYLNNGTVTIENLKITPENMAELISLVYQNKINSSAGQQILEIMVAKGGDPTDHMKDMGLEQMDDSVEMEKVIQNILKNHPDQVAQFKKGKESVVQYFVGQVMAATKGKANPKTTIEILKKLLK